MVYEILQNIHLVWAYIMETSKVINNNPIKKRKGLKRKVNKFGALGKFNDLTNNIKKDWKNLAMDNQLLVSSMLGTFEEVIAA